MDHTCVGDINSTKFEFKWTVNINSTDFTSKTSGQKVTSPAFITQSYNKDIKWRLDLYPKGHSQKEEDYMCLFLRNISRFEVETTASFSLLSSHGVRKIHQVPRGKEIFKQSQSWGYNAFVAQSFIMNLRNDALKNDEITIVCKIIVNGISNEENQSFDRLREFDDLEKLFMQEDHADLTIVSSDKERFYVHKAILAARSDVFDAMTLKQHELKQNNYTITIENFDSAVLSEVFTFIYSGKVREIKKLLFGLLRAANEFGIEGLKALCEETMIENLTTKTAVKYLIEADKNNTSIVKIIIDYIVRFSKVVVETSEFKALRFSHPDLMYEVTKSLAYYRVNCS